MPAHRRALGLFCPAGDIAEDPANPFLEPSTFIDSLADSAGCARDLPILQSLGINAIRAYSVDPTLNHDECMATFSSAGIYTMCAALCARSRLLLPSYP